MRNRRLFYANQRGQAVETTTIVYMMLAVLVGGVAVWLLLRRGQEMTPDTLFAGAQDAFVIAQTLVAAAEQLAQTGTISRDARFNYVFTRLRELFPSLSEDVLIAAIEGAVWLVTKSAAIIQPPED